MFPPFYKLFDVFVKIKFVIMHARNSENSVFNWYNDNESTILSVDLVNYI